ncbi:MAG: trigger factor [Xanthobacteraceae bacterium]|jgi:trigger factor|nr:trigger factor [Xanthobacteraceae bacterium]
MQVTATQTEGLKREFRVVVPATELDQKMLARLDVLKDQVKINGFRPGKVPVAHLKKVYGRSAMAEVIENAVRDANTQIVTDNGFKLATDPKITMPTEKAEVEELINGKSDLSYTVELEIVPEIKLGDFKAIKLEKLVADVSDAEIDKALAAIADQNKPFADKGEGTKAEDGDKLIVSFTGKLEGVPFEGGTGEDIGVNLGSNTFIPGFEPQLVGMTAGETRTIKVTFPKNYMSDTLAGKDAEFEVTAKSIEAPGTVTIDDAFAISLGLESLDKLKDAVKERLQKEHTQATRQKLKRGLLDALDETHKFEPPPTLVTEEFEAVWRSVAGEIESQGRTFADEGTDEESAKAEYQKIAERRVRLGLVLAEIGDKNNIKVADDEMTRAVVEKARQMPGREQEVWDYYRNNPQALASLRAPIFEEKVVDFLLELATVTEKNVPVEELYKEAE